MERVTLGVWAEERDVIEKLKKIIAEWLTGTNEGVM